MGAEPFGDAGQQGGSLQELFGEGPGGAVVGVEELQAAAGVGGGVRKEDTALKDKLNAAIAELAKNGKFDEITNKYPELVGKMVLPKQ